MQDRRRMKTFGDKYVWGVLKPTINGSLSPLILAPSCSHMYAPIISYYFNLVHARPPLRYLCCAPRPNILFNSPSQPYNFTWNNCRNLEVVEKNYLQFTLVLFCFFFLSTGYTGKKLQLKLFTTRIFTLYLQLNFI